MTLSNGKRVRQSGTINRLIAREYGFLPSEKDADWTAELVLEHDVLIDQWTDIHGQLFDLIKMQMDGAGAEKVDKTWKRLKKVVESFLDMIEPLCAKGPYLFGKNLTLADFVIGGAYHNMFANAKNPIKTQLAELQQNDKFKAYGAYAQRFANNLSGYLYYRP